MNSGIKKDRPAVSSRAQTGPRASAQPKGRGDAGLLLSNPALPGPFIRIAHKYPCLQRHPHPFVVRFPIVFFLSAAFFTLAFLITGSSAFETTAFHCLGGGVLFLPPAMLTGELSRRLNYPGEPKAAFRSEIRGSWLLLIMSSGAFFWRWRYPSVLLDFRWAGVVYLLLLFSAPLLVTIISYHGGLLIFPLEEAEDS